VRAGSSTGQVYSHAMALFDTAQALAGDSTRFANLAALGRARAQIAIGDYDGAAASVAAVPDDFAYLISFTAAEGAHAQNFAAFSPYGNWNYSVPDREGNNGLNYISSGDPRTSASPFGFEGASGYHPDKYAGDGSTPIVLASGVEARLIEAEAALHAGDVATWLAKLNHLRETAITPALADTTDPGTDQARVALMFRERAFWLFLTGHRQGDLRRLVREYHVPQSDIYPTGSYDFLVPGFFYGTSIDAPIPQQEAESNPLFTGCLARGA
jgi:starch-binding outer membrane protein, SusD/RagB family